MRSTIKKTVSIFLALLMVTVLFVSVSADEDKNDSDNEDRYENNESYEDDSYDDDSYDDDSYNDSNSQNQSSTQSAPIYLADYYAGTQLDLEQYLGRVVIINYFTEWCPYCMEEMPDYKKVLDTYDPEQLVVLLVHPWDGEDETNSASVVKRFGLEAATVLEDKDFSLTSAIGVPGYPTTVIVDQNGIMSYAVASKIDFDTIANVLEMLGLGSTGSLPSIFSHNQQSPVVNQPTAPDTTSGATP